jgi:hypothetical protein
LEEDLLSFLLLHGVVRVLRGGGYVAQEVLLIFNHLRADEGIGMLKDLASEAGKGSVPP